MGFLCGAKIGVDPDVQLLRAELEPAAPAPRHLRRLGQLGQTEQLAIKAPRRIFAADGNGDLDMIDGQIDHHTSAMSGASSCFMPTVW